MSTSGKVKRIKTVLDTVVIGSGPAGQRAAEYLARHGQRVAIVNPLFDLGSLKLDLSTGAALPYFTFREAVLYLSGARQAAFYKNRHESPTRPRLSRHAITHRIESVAKWSNETALARLHGAGVSVVHGVATFLTPTSLLVTETKLRRPITLTASNFIIATGSRVVDNPEIAFDGRAIVPIDRLLHALSLKMPRRPVFVGATTQGIEFASTLASLPNIDLTIVESQRHILPTVDDGMRRRLLSAMESKRVKFRLGTHADHVQVVQPSGDVVIKLSTGETIHTDMAIFAQDTFGNTASLNLPAVVDDDDCLDDRGFIRVNADMQTALPHIYAVGNVIAHTGVSYLSSQQGIEAARRILGEHVEHHSTDANLVPVTINSIPMISRVGPTEQDLHEQGVPFVTGYADFGELAIGQMLQRPGFMKIFVCPKTKDLLAVHALGTAANELIHIGQAVIAHRGSATFLLTNIWNFPSFAEAYRVAALDALRKCT